MAVTSIYKVLYHFEIGGKKSSPDYSDYVAVSTPDYASIQTALSNNGLIRGGNALKITAVRNVGCSGLS